MIRALIVFAVLAVAAVWLEPERISLMADSRAEPIYIVRPAALATCTTMMSYPGGPQGITVLTPCVGVSGGK